MHPISNPRLALAAAVLGLAVIAGVTGLQLWLTDSWRPHDPAPPWLRAVFGVAWAIAQAATLAAVCGGTPRRFGLLIAGVSVLGLGVMTIGRSGLTPDAWAVWLLCSLAMIALGAASVRLLSVDDTGTHEVRLFLMTAAIGTVYLYSARLADGLAQIGAMGAAMLILSLLAANRERLRRAVTFFQRQSPTAVAALLWISALLLLAVNLAVKTARGVVTPQVGPIAPYQIAAVLMLAAGALARATSPSLFSRVSILHFAGFLLCSALMFKTDAGTLAITFLGLAIVFAVLGQPLAPILVIAGCVITVGLARGSWVPTLVEPFSTRIADRISGWAGHARPNDQMTRVDETFRLIGATGHAGAARPLLLIGTEASRDYMPAVIAAQGGIAGILLTSAFLLRFVVEFLRRLFRVREVLPRALCAALFGAFAANVLVATLWVDQTTPLAGIPAPLLARAGSHLTAAALMLGIVAFGTRPEGDNFGGRLSS